MYFPHYADVNECDTGDNNCDENANCADNEGSFTCSCKDGYHGNGTTCCKNYIAKLASSYRHAVVFVTFTLSYTFCKTSEER